MAYTRTKAGARTWVLAAVMLAALAVVPAGAATASPTGTVSRSGAAPVGLWSLQVHLGGQTYTSGVRFTPAGRAFLTVLAGSGTWTATGDNRFSFRIAEPMVDKNGTYFGWVDINQNAVLTGNTFTSSGISRQYDANDNLTRSVLATDDGTRS